MRRCFIWFFTSLSVATLACGVEVEGLPEPGSARAAQFVTPVERTLANGLRVIVVERPGLPLLDAALIVRAGSRNDPAQLAGLASFTAALLRQGTQSRSATKLASQIELLGATIKADANRDATVLSLTTLTAQAPAAFALLADIVRRPKFAPAEIERLRRQRLDDLLLQLEEPHSVARLAAARVIFGDDPYAHPEDGTPASVKRFTRQAIAAFHRETFTPENATLVIAGSTSAAEAFALAEQVFGDWAGPEIQQQPAFPAHLAPRVLLVDMPNAGQAAVVVGALSPRRGDADFLTGKVANGVLGGGYSARLNQEIRVKRGLSYGAASELNGLRFAGMFSARCQTKNESAAEVAQIVCAEIQRLSSEPAPADYLAARQAVLTGSYARSLETNAGYISALGELALHDLPLAELNQSIANIEAVTPDAVQTFAAKELGPDGFSVVVAGQAKLCADALRKVFPNLEVIPMAELALASPSLRHPAKAAAAQSKKPRR